jgi:hypothetical protein
MTILEKNTMKQLAVSALLLICWFTGRSGAEEKPKVVVKNTGKQQTIELSEKQAKWFLGDLSGPKFRSNISKASAIPIAYIDAQGKKYEMHGNAVILVVGKDEEYLWCGPYLQALVLEWKKTKGDLKLATDNLEKLKDLSDIKMDPPGAYPGGGPAPLINQNK